MSTIDTTSPLSLDAPASERPTGITPIALKVLVVEDEDAARQALVTAVWLLGHECRGARDGLEAWEMHQRQRADVILSDWEMPRMNGLELCRRTRVSHDVGAYTYFIFTTSFTDKAHFIRGMEAGADDYQTKPVDLDELRARLVSAGRVIALCRELAEKNARLRRDSQASFRIARVDTLTQIANRLSMDEELEAIWSRVKRYGHRYTIAMCDIDLFKAYNDRFGHLAGDDALRRVAHAIREKSARRRRPLSLRRRGIRRAPAGAVARRRRAHDGPRSLDGREPRDRHA